VTITTLSSRALNQDVTRAKRAACRGPVIITDRGKPAHVLLSFVEFGKRHPVLGFDIKLKRIAKLRNEWHSARARKAPKRRGVGLQP